MEPNPNNVTERILQLTLEIIYLLTGEDNIVVKKILEDGQDPITVPLHSFLIPQRNNEQKILEVTQKIIDLLTRESGNWSNYNVRIKEEIKEEEEELESVMKEWEYLEEDKDLYKDTMMDNQPPLTSPDGSRDPPQRCHRPPQDSIQEGHTIINHVQGLEVFDIKTEIKEEEVETYVSGDQLSMNEDEMMLTKESSLDVGTGRCDGWNTSEGDLILSSDCNEDDNNGANYSTGVSLVPEKINIGKGPFFCSECGKGFTQKHSLIMHQRNHTNERPFPCQDCGKSFKVKFCLDRHVELHVHRKGHSDKEIFSCTDCKKSFLSKCDLVIHQSIHTGEPPFSCPDCKKVFKNRRNLVRHQSVHTGEKPFSCSVCGKSFAQKSQLTSHQILHTGEKPFSCSECSKCFASKGNRDKHMRVHTGEKPFSCSDCGKCFAHKPTLIIHQKKHITLP